MEISGEGLLHFHQETSSLICYQTNHKTNILLPYQLNSCFESDYECICIVDNGKTCSVPLNILSSVYIWLIEGCVGTQLFKGFHQEILIN